MTKKIILSSLLLLLVLLSFYIISQKFEKILVRQKVEDKSNSLNQKYLSLLTSSHFSGRIFPIKKIYNLTNDSPFSTRLYGYNIITIFTDMRCGCQIRELKNIDSLYKKLYKDGIINAVAIYDGLNIVDAVLLKKESNASFPFYYTDGNEFDSFNFSKKYPAIFLIYDQRIISSLFPLSNDTLLSSYFYRNLSQVLTN